MGVGTGADGAGDAANAARAMEACWRARRQRAFFLSYSEVAMRHGACRLPSRARPPLVAMQRQLRNATVHAQSGAPPRCGWPAPAAGARQRQAAGRCTGPSTGPSAPAGSAPAVNTTALSTGRAATTRACSGPPFVLTPPARPWYCCCCCCCWTALATDRHAIAAAEARKPSRIGGHVWLRGCAAQK